MTRFSKTALMLGVAIIALSACSGTRGPGAIGTKDDIKVTSKGMPGEKGMAPPPPAGDFSSTVEQAEAVPAPDVAQAEPLPDNSPAMQQAVEQQDAASAMPSPAAVSPADTSTASPSETRPIDAVAPAEPVTNAAVAPPASMPAPATVPETPVASTQPSSVYPAADYANAQPAPAPVPTDASERAAAPSPYAYVPAPTGYQPQDPNAPYSPKAAAEAAARTADTSSAPGTVEPITSSAGAINYSDPSVIRSAQAALKTKVGYRGLESGEIDATFLNALSVYQAQNGLPQGGLNEATLRSLGVIQ